MNKIDNLIKDKKKLRDRVMDGLDRELKRQKSAGKEFLSEDEIDKLVDDIIKEELGDSWKETYNDKFTHYKQAADVVEKVLDVDYSSLESVITESFVDIPYKFKRQFYSHVNMCFMNVTLNRLDEFNNPVEIKKRIRDSRKIVDTIIKNLENE